MDLRLLEYFVAIAECGSLTRAAEKLFISQPALSQRLKKLEEDMGTPLFDRVGSRLVLNEAGIIFLNGAQSALFVRQKAYEKLREVSGLEE